MKTFKKNISENSQVEIRDYGGKNGLYGERIEIEIKKRSFVVEHVFDQGELEELINLIRDYLNDLEAEGNVGGKALIKSKIQSPNKD